MVLLQYLIGDGDVGVLAKSVAFGESGGRVFDQVEGAQLAERHEQFLDLSECNRRQCACCPRVAGEKPSKMGVRGGDRKTLPMRAQCKRQCGPIDVRLFWGPLTDGGGEGGREGGRAGTSLEWWQSEGERWSGTGRDGTRTGQAQSLTGLSRVDRCRGTGERKREEDIHQQCIGHRHHPANHNRSNQSTRNDTARSASKEKGPNESHRECAYRCVCPSTYLILVEVVGQTADEEFVRRIGNDGAHGARSAAVAHACRAENR